jgi:hypothetical protein
LLLIISLLFAQSAAFAHASTHQTERTDTDITSKPQLCGECLAGAVLLGAAGTPFVPLIGLAPAIAAHLTTLVCAQVEQRSYSDFQSRAPPHPC